MELSTQPLFDNITTKIEEDLVFNNKKPKIITSNTKIFPSLHPLGSFYSAKNKTSSLKLPTSQQYPIKKVKLNDQSDKDIINEDQPIIQQKPLQVVKSCSSLEEFRLPKLPKRLIDKKKNQETIISEVHQTVNISTEQPLAVPDIFKNFNIESQAISSPNEFSSIANAPLKFQISGSTIEDLIAYFSLENDQTRALFKKIMEVMTFRSYMKKLEMDFLAIQLRPNINHLLKICEQNQQRYLTSST